MNNDREILSKIEEIKEHQIQIEKLRIELFVLVKEADKINLDFITYNI